MRFSQQRVGSGWEALVVNTYRCNELVFRYSKIVFRCNEFVYCCSERSLPYDNWRWNEIVEMLCLYDKICLLSIDNIDHLMIDIHDGILA